MRLWTTLKRSFLAGLVLITPLLITLYILQVLVGFSLTYIDPVVQGADLAQYTEDVELLARVVAVVLIVSGITLVGYIAQLPVGQRLFGGFGRAVSVIPIVRTIYSTIRQLANSFSSTESSYDSLVLIEFPRRGVYSIGLATGDSPQAVSDVAGTQVQNVFLPSSPNPASGRLVLVPEDQIHEVDLSVSQGLRMLMTTGVGSDENMPIPDPIDVPLESERAEQIADDESDTDDDGETDDASDEKATET